MTDLRAIKIEKAEEREPAPGQPIPRQPPGITPTRPVKTTLLGVIMAAVLLIGVAIGIFVVSSGGNDQPTIVVATAIAQKDGMVQVYVPEGDFEMGFNDDGASYRRPRHTVYLDAFFLDQTEVTNTMFSDFLNEMGNQVEGDVTWLAEENKRVLIEQVNGIFQPKSGFADYPVTEVSWYGASAYCEWAERRLPTEAEWEKAALGTDGRKYPWGNESPTGDLFNLFTPDYTRGTFRISPVSNYTRETYGISPVGNYPAGASPYGALDMATNVSEWLEDYTYPSDCFPFVPKNPTGPSDFGTKPFRHSGIRKEAGAVGDLRCSSRLDASSHGGGFRCARSP